MIQYFAAVDEGLLQHLYAQRDVATTLFFIGVTELGSTIFVCGIMLCVAILLVYRPKIPYAIALAVGVLGAGGSALLIKEVVRRARPAEIYQAYVETGFSFPSGHATLSAALYGFFMYLLYRMMPTGRKRTAAIAALALLIVLIAFSRLYLGVHYLSDVLGGLLLGAAFAYLGAVFVKKFEGRT